MSEFTEEAQLMVMRAFSAHNISLHIDDGWMGGGNQIAYVRPLNFNPTAGNDNDFYDFKWGNAWDVNNNGLVDMGIDNLHGNFNVRRLGIFHYCVFGYNYTESPQSSGKSGGIPDDDFFVSQGLLTWADMGSNASASTFMHELGHNLGLRHFGDVDLPNNSSAYVSIMSYYYQLNPERWPTEWGGNPNYGSKPGWNDWDHLN